MSVIRLTPCRYDSPAPSGRCKGAVLPHIASGRRELHGESAKLERTNDGKITQGRGINSDGGEASLASDTSGLKLRHGVSRHNTAITGSGLWSGQACGDWPIDSRACDVLIDCLYQTKKEGHCPSSFMMLSHRPAHRAGYSFYAVLL